MTKNPLRLVAYCGLYCSLCANRNRIPKRAKLLQETLHGEGMDLWYKYIPSMKDVFPTFWEFLDKLVKTDCACRTEGGPPDCKIRECAKKKAVDTCPLCQEYPCSLIESLAEHYVTAIQDGKRLKKIGLKAWVKEQEERARRGVVYADTRVPWKE
ncbi:MAG: DUF3795 domain-containing protein [Candidatus Bathyarchaeota archaeon]|nr:DUF3795 domain-containing protein [Candidatus Bathyarchaeota archaeon]MDH5494637.1 DUF3795 domain-containing protein [Candidatus Bathyarchaeota archaeon]